MSMTTVDGKKLRQVFNSSETAKTVLNYFLERERDRGFIDLTRLHGRLEAEHPIVRLEWDELWQQLMDMKVGTFVVGRRGKPSRFVLNYSLKTFAENVKKGKSFEMIKTQTKIEKEVIAPKPAMEAKAFLVPIPFGQGKQAMLSAPQGTTREELKAISNYLQKLLG